MDNETALEKAAILAATLNMSATLHDNWLLKRRATSIKDATDLLHEAQEDLLRWNSVSTEEILCAYFQGLAQIRALGNDVVAETARQTTHGYVGLRSYPKSHIRATIWFYKPEHLTEAEWYYALMDTVPKSDNPFCDPNTIVSVNSSLGLDWDFPIVIDVDDADADVGTAQAKLHVVFSTTAKIPDPVLKYLREHKLIQPNPEKRPEAKLEKVYYKREVFVCKTPEN